MKITAPGKLMLSGEWSVLEVGIPCVVIAIDQNVGVEITASDSITLNAPDLGLESIQAGFDGKKLSWKKQLDVKELEKLSVSKNAIELSLLYLKAKGKTTQGFNMTTFSTDTLAKLPNGETAKVGFGSSAAICVAIVSAILKQHGFDLSQTSTKDLIYKIACTAHYLAQGKVVKEMNSGKSIAEVMDSEWPAFLAENLQLPQDFKLLVGFVGYSASTKELILKLNSFKTGQKEHYWQIINSIKGITEQLITALKQNKQEEIIRLLKENRKQLQDLSNSSQNNLETPELSKLADIAEQAGAAGKFSGAGGGDCGIAACFDESTAEKIKAEWEKNKIIPLSVKISENGVC